MTLIFHPAIALLNRLRYLHKFIIAGAIFFLPLLIVSYFLLNEVNDRIEFMKQEQPGIEYISELRTLMQHVQMSRSAYASLQNDNGQFKARATQEAALIDESFKRLQSLNARIGERLDIGNRLSQVEHAWTTLNASAGNQNAEQSFTEHTALISRLLSLITHVSNTSNMVLASKLDTHYLIDTLVVHLPSLSEAMGQARAIASTVAAQGLFTPENWEQLLISSLRIGETKNQIARGQREITEANPELASHLQPMVQPLLESADSFVQLLKTMLDEDELTLSTEQIFNESTKAIDASYTHFDAIVPALNGLLDARIQQYQTLHRLTIGLTVSILLILLYSITAFYLSIMRPINDLRSGISQIAEGDLTVQFKLATRDETSHIAEQLNAMTGQFRELVGKVMHSTQQVSTAAEHLSMNSEKTSQGINEQLMQTDQVATAMNEMSATVQEVARSAAATSSATHGAQQEAATGNDVVRTTVNTINTLASGIRDTATLVRQLGENSNDIGQVVDVIKGIAEQTNLLALNAAIEAARAGEQGRGFAVVADEVRTLASRTQQSTQEIQAMIERLQEGARRAVQAMEDSERSTDEGVSMISQAGNALDSINHSVTTIADMSAQIASAAEEQSTVADEIDRNVTEIAKISDQNAAASTQTAKSSGDLAQLAEELNRLVSIFRV